MILKRLYPCFMCKKRNNFMFNICRIYKKAKVIKNLSQTAFHKVDVCSNSQNWVIFKGSLVYFSPSSSPCSFDCRCRGCLDLLYVAVCCDAEHFFKLLHRFVILELLRISCPGQSDWIQKHERCTWIYDVWPLCSPNCDWLPASLHIKIFFLRPQLYLLVL